jgi:BirA family biotin operon repressor/biotin-[acetyl-CoA-carboxylase] ligase
MCNLAELDAELAGTVFAGKLHFDRVTGSTNSDAVAAARSGEPHGSVFFADEQSGGRGRSDHGWVSTAGEGLYVSVLLRPRISALRLPLLPLAAGLAAAEAVHVVSGLTIDLRWPNDLLIGPRKIGGILVESQTKSVRDKTAHNAAAAGSGVAFAVAGIGINVHQRSFPSGLATPATSLDLESGKRFLRRDLLVALLKSLEREANTLADPNGPERILSRVEQASTWVRGRRVIVHGPQACQGVTAGLDKNGFLRVETPDGLVTVQTGGLRSAETD